MVPGHESIWVDGSFTQALPLPDRGLDYGDGLFETLLLIEGRPLHLKLHLQRLQAGLKVLGFPDCLHEVTRQVSLFLSSLNLPVEASMRVTVTRGSGPRGYLPPIAVKPRIILTASERVAADFTRTLPPAHLALADIRWGSQPALAGIKHLNRLEQVLAATQRQSVDSDELVMLDQAGGVISVTAGNLFIYDGAELLTPAISHCGIMGTRRRLILEQLAPSLGVPVREAQLSLGQLESASEVFYSNALIGVRPVASFGNSNWNKHPLCTALHKLVCEGAA